MESIFIFPKICHFFSHSIVVVVVATNRASDQLQCILTFPAWRKQFNRLTMKAKITMMCYALLMIQGKCSDRSPLIVTFFAILITGTQVMVKVVAKYSSYIAVYRLKNM
jgi:hypothetical protein